MQKKIHRTRKNRSNKIFEREAQMEKHKVELARYEHEAYYSEYNPEYQKYGKLFNKINYFSEDDLWKCQYYEHFLQNKL